MISEILYFVFVFPLESILGFGLECVFKWVHSYGLSIIILSILVNVFLLKIFILTDKKAEFESERKKRLDSRIKAWKSVYKKAKLFAFTQTLYRQNHYHPIYALSALGGLAVQIPFFYAMYFVVKNADMKGKSFLWIGDLSAPDVIWGVHLLPILMTIISLVNVWIVAKERGARIQGAMIALIFLVLLYQMPSALVLYWTSNMAFSLVRAIFAKWRQGNSSLDKHSSDLANRHKARTQSPLSLCPFTKNHESENPSVVLKAQGVKSKLSTFFIFRKPIKIAVISLSAILAFLLCATFALTLSAPHSAKLKFIEGGEAQIDYAINALLRSKSMSAGVEIVGVEWDSSIDSSAIKVLGNSQRTINFYAKKPLDLKSGAHLGKVQFRLDLSPLFKNLFIYYFGILGAVMGIYLLLCVIAHFQTYNESHLKSYKTTILYAILCIAFLICVFSPYQLYSTDITQFDSTQTIATLCALFGAFMLISFIVIYALSFIPKRFSNFVAFILSVILFSGIVYSFILVGDYGAMDHFVLQKAPEKNPKQILEFIAVSVLGVALIAFRLKKLMRVWQIAFATLLIVSGVNATNIVLKHADSADLTQFAESNADSNADSNAESSADSSVESSVESGVESGVDSTADSPPHLPYEKELFSYSKNGKNIVVIVLDAFSGSHTPHILEQFPHFKTALDGFTLFPNTTSTTNSTIHSVATLIGGEYYATYNMNKRKENLAKQIDSAFISIANAFANADFSVSFMAFVGSKVENIKTNSEVFALDAGSRAFLNYYIRAERLFDTIKANTDKNSKYIQTAQLATFGLFKFAPKPLQPSIYNDGFWLLNNKSNVTTAIGYTATFYAPTHILNADSTKPTFKYFHSMMTHAPYGMHFHNDKCEFFSDKSAWNDYPHNAHIDSKYAHQQFDTEACALKYLTHYLQSLKNAGIYDNTQIFVVSDHGNGSINIPIESRLDSLLLFKDFGARGNLKIDNRLMANYDIASIFCENLKNGCPNVGQNILKNYPTNREIIHTIPSAWKLERHRPNEWILTKAYKVRGNIYEAKNWTDISDEKYGIVNVR